MVGEAIPLISVWPIAGTILQAGAGALVFARPSRDVTRFVVALLFFLNALVSASLVALAAAVPDAGSASLAIRLADGPTGSLLVVLAWLLARGHAWGPRVRFALAAWLAYVAVGTLALLAPPSTLAAWAQAVYGGIDAFVGLGAVLVALTGRVTRGAGGASGPETHLLLVGFGCRAVEFGAFYALAPWWSELVEPTSTLRLAAVLAYPAMGVVATVSLVAIGRAAWRARAHGRDLVPVLATLVGAGLLGVAEHAATAWFPYYVVSTITLFVVRPVVVAGALAGPRAWSLAGATAFAIVAFVAAKLLLSATLGTTSTHLTWVDAVAAALLLLAWPLRKLAASASRAVASQAAPARAPPEAAPAPTATRAERLGLFLLDEWERSGGAGEASPDEIQLATGITPNNLAGEVKRLARRLGADEASGPAMVTAREASARGRKVYRLTPAGAEAARALKRPPDAP